jgi:diguanylate cyclase (GGDEF)-like protein
MSAIGALLIIALTATVFLTVRNNTEAEEILAESIKGQLIAISFNARDIIEPHIDLFKEMDSQASIDARWNAWLEVAEELSALNDESGSEYIYALREIDGEYYFIFDTDPEAIAEHDIFESYELSPVHHEAFEGQASADVMNVEDEWGSYNTGAVPLYDSNGQLAGIVSVDITDELIERIRSTSTFYATTLIAATSIAVIAMLLILTMLIRRNSRMQQHLYRLANYDAVTGLSNRNRLFSYLAQEVPRLEAQGGPFAVYFIDLDNFKTVNDNAGHDTGDDLLRTISHFLSDYADNSSFASQEGMDALTTRIGGDEFIQLLPGITTAEEAATYASSLLQAFGAQPELQEYARNYGVGLSIGISLFPSMQTDYDELIKYADIAMYHAKDGGKNNFRVYDPAMGDEVEGVELSVRSKSGNKPGST